MKIARTVAGLALAAGLVLTLSSCQKAAAKAQLGYEFATIGRGSIESLVSSSGTLSVVSSVSVLAEMSGRLEKVSVDFNERVKKGQVLATINTDLLRLQARAAQAAVDKAGASHELQALAAQNAAALSAKGLLSDYDLKAAQSSLKVSAAELESSRATLEQINTEIDRYAIITSPMDGIVLSRDVDPGQSVVGGSSASSTSLFTIAGDLSRMQIKAEVDELDISSISVGQEVRFTVGSMPGQGFAGRVKEVRLVPETSDNVVYYYVIIDADNRTGRLLPGMTASVSFIKHRKVDVLVAPNSALRFTPSSLSAAEIQKAVALAGMGPMTASEREAASKSYDEGLKAQAAAGGTRTSAAAKAPAQTGLASLIGGAPGFGGPPGMRQGGAADKAVQEAGQAHAGSAAVKKPLWYLDSSGALAVEMVELGLSDGSKTEIAGPSGVEGRKFILKAKVE